MIETTSPRPLSAAIRAHLPLFVLALLPILFFPAMTVLPVISWTYSPGVLYAYLLLAPLPAMLLYRQQKKAGYVSGKLSRPHKGLVGVVGGVLPVAFCLSAADRTEHWFSIAANQNELLDAFPDPILLIHIAIWVAAGAWLLCLIVAPRGERNFPVLYFFFSAILSAMAHLLTLFYCLDTQGQTTAILPALFFPLKVFFGLCVAAMVFWFALQFFAKKKAQAAAGLD